MEEQNNIDIQEEEFNYIELIQKLWYERKFIIKCTLCFIIAGLIYAFTAQTIFTANVTVVPQTGEKSKSSSGLGALSSMAGVNLGEMGAGEVLSPKVYPEIVSSIKFQKELMMTPLKFAEQDTLVTLFDYLTNEKYQSFSILGFIKKYTIGLPGLLMKSLRSEPTAQKTEIETLTKEEFDVSEFIKNNTSVDLFDNDGYISINVDFVEPLATAQLAQNYLEILQKYVTEFKVCRFILKQEYLTERFEENKSIYEQAQDALANFRDANAGFISAKARTQEERLVAEYSLAFSVYSDLAKQLEQAKLAVKDETPILTVIKPIVVPFKKSKPKRATILLAFALLGGICACGWVIGKPYINEFKKIFIHAS